MAYELTHIRFALDLRDTLRITNEAEYVAGSIYPDSRYVTKIDRRLTHQDGPQDLFDRSLTDFGKGWATHIYYDTLARHEMRKFIEHADAVQQYNAVWIDLTVAKLFDDIEAYAHMTDRLGFVRAVGSSTYPNGETRAAMDRYYHLVRDCYRDQPTIEHYRSMWQAFGAPAIIIDTMVERAKIVSTNVGFLEHVHAVYPRVLEAALMRRG